MKIINVCPERADKKVAKWRATPHDSEKQDKGRQQRERRETTEQISFAFSYPNLNKKKQIEQD